MSKVSPTIQYNPNPQALGSLTIVGDLEVNNGEMLVYTGQEWSAIDIAQTDTERYECNNEELHNEHPTLKNAWEEYKALRRLVTGE